MKAWNWLLVVALMGFGLSACGGGGGASCGDGVVDDGETCDDGVDNSDTTADACRTDCTAAACGDSVQDTGEQCDDGNTTDGDGCSAACVFEGMTTCGDDEVQGAEQCEPNVDQNCHPVGHVNECRFIRTAFRMNSLALFDPFFSLPAPAPCNPGFMDFVNDQLTGSSTGDKFSTVAPPESLDGLIDLGFVFTFANPIQQGDAGENSATFTVSDCNATTPAPVPNPSPCAPTVNAEPSETVFTATTQTGAATCLDELEGTTNRTVDPVVAGDNGCFASAPLDFAVILGTLLTIPLEETVIAAQWSGNPADGLLTGLVRGWLPRAAAETLIVPDLTFIPEGPFTDAVRVGSCTQYDDNDGAEGFWLYLNFTAEPVPWEGGPMCGNGVVDTGGERDEVCDPGIAEGSEGECGPLLDCDDSVACTDDSLNLGDPCDPRCYHRGFLDQEDGCCSLTAPQVDGIVGGTVSALGLNDNDCVDLCDDGTLQAFESCDPTEGTACDDVNALCVDDGDACTIEDTFLVLDGTNTAVRNLCVQCPAGADACECKRTTITQIGPDDGCCPASCDNVPPPAGCASDPNCI